MTSCHVTSSRFEIGRIYGIYEINFNYYLDELTMSIYVLTLVSKTNEYSTLNVSRSQIFGAEAGLFKFS